MLLRLVKWTPLVGTDKLVLAPSRSPNEMLLTAQLHNPKTQKRTA